MIGQSDFQKILQILQRPINCLADEDRNIRKSGLDSIKKQVSSMEKNNMLKLFNETKITSMLAKVIGDKIENNRQLVLDIIQILIKNANRDAVNIYEQLLSSLIARINQVPFPEKSEDLRLKLINVIIKLVPYKECFLKHLPQLASAMAKCLADAYDEIKYSSCELINKLSIAMPHQIGKYSLSIIVSLRDNLKHQKFKVRKTSLQSISHILITDGAGGSFEQVKVSLKAVLSDKKEEVRVAAYHCTTHLLLYLGPKYMKEYQACLIGFLLMGLDDQSQNIVRQVMQLLQKTGKKLRQQSEQTMRQEQKTE